MPATRLYSEHGAVRSLLILVVIVTSAILATPARPTSAGQAFELVWLLATQTLARAAQVTMWRVRC
jgi:hypothetical protein